MPLATKLATFGAALLLCITAYAQQAYAADGEQLQAVGAGIVNVGTQAYSKNSVQYEVNSGVATITGYTGSASSLDLNSLNTGYVIIKIKSGAFEGCTSLRTVTLPSTLQTIESSAFKGCSRLTAITLPESLTSLGSNAFENCTSLTSVTVKSRDLSLSWNDAFGNAGTGSSGITATFASTCKRVPDNMFSPRYSGAPKLVKVSIASGVGEIGGSAFANCGNLSSVSLGSGIVTIGSDAFAGCAFTSISLPGTLQTIKSSAFKGCSRLTSVTLPESLASLGSHAFENCTSLTSVTAKSRDLSVDWPYDAFGNAGTGSSGITATFASTCKCVPGNMFRSYNAGAPKLVKVTVASGVGEIGGHAFVDCGSLSSVSLPSSVRKIGDHAFEDCTSLKSLRIPQAVPSGDIGREAFVNLGLGSKVTVETADQYEKLKKNSDYITTTRTEVVLAANSLARASVGKVAKKVYTGKKITPSPTVKLSGKTLKKGTDYTLSYSNNRKVGLATIKVKGKGKYVGTKTVSFRIMPAKVTKVKAKAKGGTTVEMRWSTAKNKKSGAQGYQLCYKVGKKATYSTRYGADSSFASYYGFPRGKKVTIKVRAYYYDDGKYYYGAWSKSSTAKVR